MAEVDSDAATGATATPLAGEPTEVAFGGVISRIGEMVHDQLPQMLEAATGGLHGPQTQLLQALVSGGGFVADGDPVPGVVDLNSAGGAAIIDAQADEAIPTASDASAESGEEPAAEPTHVDVHEATPAEAG